MKKLSFALILLLSTIACQKNEISFEETKQNFRIENLAFKDLPNEILEIFDNNNYAKTSSSKTFDIFGSVNTSIPVIRNKFSEDKLIFTIALNKADQGNKSKSKEELYFDNLVIKVFPDDRKVKYIIRYKPNYYWYFKTSRDLEVYSGSIEIFDLNGKKLGKTQILDGIDSKESNSKGSLCKLSLESTMCVGGEGSMTDQPFTCTYTYEIDSCTSTNTTSDYDGTLGDDSSSTENSIEEGGSSSGGLSKEDGSIETNPIIEEPCDTNNIDAGFVGKDGSCIEIEASQNLADWDALDDNKNIDESVYDYSCLVEVLNAVLALDHNLVDETINRFCGNDDYKLTFTIGDCDGNPACTSDTLLNTTGEIVIKIQDVALNPIDFATHILHESIHAEIFRYVDAHHNGEVDPNDKPQLFEYYARYKLAYDSTHIDHPYMTQYYIDPIAGALQKLDNFRYTNLDYYKVFAYDGLRDFDPYEDFVTIDEDFGQYRNEVIENFNVKCND